METNEIERIARPVAGNAGEITYSLRLTPAKLTDQVVLHYEPLHVLPVIFVPGIMGSNLCDIKKPKDRVWRLDTSVSGQPAGLALQKGRQGAGDRQRTLHPDRTKVDNQGNVPSRIVGSVLSTEIYRARGWGEISEGSYHEFLLELEEVLNSHRSGNRGGKTVAEQFEALMKLRPEGGERDAPWRPIKGFAPATAKETQAANDWLMPVYACGYNWLQDNAASAQVLAARIKRIIAAHQDGTYSFCKQVVLVTHSMGGLVARACTKLPGIEALVAGVVHGVMPANGAAVAYRRCKVGMADENWLTSFVIGRNGQETTAVFAQSPGALELLPTQNYNTGWLSVLGPDGKTVDKALPLRNPYEEIYGRRDRWWALIKEEWLAPEGGTPITWKTFSETHLSKAVAFHAGLTPNEYHPNTYAFYGADTAGKTQSFERIVWSMKRGDRSDGAAPQEVFRMSAQQAELRGGNPEYVGRSSWAELGPDGSYVVEGSQWELRVALQDASGDGTVPSSSGHAPASCSIVKQVFRLTGCEHERAYQHRTAQQIAVYSLIKIAADALWPEPFAAKKGLQ